MSAIEPAVLEDDREGATAEPPGERRTSPIELLWDLVFVFAVTQVTATLAVRITWARFGRAMLVLALVWWAWSAFVWAANAQDPDSRALRLALMVAMGLVFVTGIAIPSAFAHSGAPVFASTYACVRLIHLALYADASRKGNASWRAIAGFGVTVVIGMVLLVIGSFLDVGPRVALWLLAAVLDYSGPALLTRQRLRGLQQVAVAHFAERYGLFVLICLGESIVATGLGTHGARLDAELVVAALSGLLIIAGMWWTYFEQLAPASESRLGDHEDPVLAAADGYSYMHLLIVAGVIVFAAGIRFAIRDGAAELATGPRLALCGGVALFLAGQAGFRARLHGAAGWSRPLGAAAALLLFVVSAGIAGWAVAALMVAVVAGVAAAETFG